MFQVRVGRLRKLGGAVALAGVALWLVTAKGQELQVPGAQEYVAGGNKEVELVYPTEGTYIAPEGMALVKNSPNPVEAKKFYDFLASKQAQEMLVKKYFRRPMREDVDTTKVGLKRINEFKAAPIDHVKATATQPAFIKTWKEMVAAK